MKKILLALFLVGCSDGNFDIPPAEEVDGGCEPLKCSANNCDIMPDGCGGTVNCTKQCSVGKVCGGTEGSSSGEPIGAKMPHQCAGNCIYRSDDPESCPSPIATHLMSCSNVYLEVKNTIVKCTVAVNGTSPTLGYSRWCCPNKYIE